MTALKSENNCPVCGGKKFNFVRSLNTYVCVKCGYVIPALKHLRHDIAFSKEEKRGTIRKRTKDMIGKVNILYSKGYETAKEKYLREIDYLFEEVRNMFPTIKSVDIQTAKRLLGRYLASKASKKRRVRKKILVLGLTYLATKINNTQRLSLKRIEEKYKHEDITAKDIRKVYKYIVKTLRIKIPRRRDEERRFILTKLRREIGRDKEVEDLMKKLYQQIHERKIGMGRSKKTILAAIAYISYKLFEYNVTQRKVAAVVGITEIPLREMIKEILNRVQIEIQV